MKITTNNVYSRLTKEEQKTIKSFIQNFKETLTEGDIFQDINGYLENSNDNITSFSEIIACSGEVVIDIDTFNSFNYTLSVDMWVRYSKDGETIVSEFMCTYDSVIAFEGVYHINNFVRER